MDLKEAENDGAEDCMLEDDGGGGQWIEGSEVESHCWMKIALR